MCGNPAGNTSRFLEISNSSADCTPRQIVDVDTPPGPWSTSGPLSRGFSWKDLPCLYFLGYSGHLADP